MMRNKVKHKFPKRKNEGKKIYAEEILRLAAKKEVNTIPIS